MKDLIDIIIERLHLNKNTTTLNDFEDVLEIDENGYTKVGHKLAKNANGYLFWVLAWKYLYEHGPMRKVDLIQAMNNEGLTEAKPTSNATTFAKLNSQGIICGVKGKLEARLPKDWYIY